MEMVLLPQEEGQAWPRGLPVTLLVTHVLSLGPNVWENQRLHRRPTD